MFRVALDAMGGDNAPSVPVSGAVAAAQKGIATVLLVGDEKKIRSELSMHSANDLPIRIIPSEGKIEDGEPPALALRQKPTSSIAVATGLVEKGLADAIVSMGSTGATMASAAVILGTINGIERPSIGGPIIGAAPNQVILDLGANLDCRPSQLLGFGVLGSVFCKQVLKVESPRIALLSVGSESGKGNKQVKEATDLFSCSGLNFIGNVEGNDLTTGAADVVVCDGFVGNILLKLIEGLGGAMYQHLQQTLENKVPLPDLEDMLRELHRRNNVVDSRGGGPVFGVNGVSIIGHGSANSGTIERAIEMAKMCVETKLIQEMNLEVPRVMEIASQELS